MHDFANNDGRWSKTSQDSRGLSAIAELLVTERYPMAYWFLFAFACKVWRQNLKVTCLKILCLNLHMLNFIWKWGGCLLVDISHMISDEDGAEPKVRTTDSCIGCCWYLNTVMDNAHVKLKHFLTVMLAMCKGIFLGLALQLWWKKWKAIAGYWLTKQRSAFVCFANCLVMLAFVIS